MTGPWRRLERHEEAAVDGTPTHVSKHYFFGRKNKDSGRRAHGFFTLNERSRCCGREMKDFIVLEGRGPRTFVISPRPGKKFSESSELLQAARKPQRQCPPDWSINNRS